MSYKITHKVGVKILSEQQLENVLPTYENLFHKIDTCREVAKEEREELLQAARKNEKRHYQYNFMYDNVFSILGRRGTGKTSVAFTLRKIIKSRYAEHYDVIMPLIIPEVIPEDCTILGWLLAIVKEEIIKLENKISESDDNSAEQFFERCKYGERSQKESSLEKQLEELSQLFYAKGYNPGRETSYHLAIDNSARQAEDYYRFAAKIAELWDAWIDRICYLHTLENGKRKTAEEVFCPLIYFIFDDVDLAPEKIEELLSVIIKYLSHPNIVVITTADEELFLEVLENRMDKKIGRYQRDLRSYLSGRQVERDLLLGEISIKENVPQREDVISQTARMYLGKVLPTSTRFYLRLYNSAEEKAAFYLEDDTSLGKGVADLVQGLIDCRQDSDRQEVINFMIADDRVINFYLKFVGNTSRQIGNVYIALQDLIDNLIKIACQTDDKQSSEKRLRQIYINCRYFICVAINANHTLSNMIERVDNFVDELFLYEYNQWKMYCDYTYLHDYLQKKLSDETKSVQVSIGLQIFALLSFIENIMLIMEKLVPGGITCRTKTHEALYLAQYIGSVAFDSRVVFRCDLDSHTFFRHYVNLLNRVEIIVEDEMPDIKFNLEYFYNFRYYCEECTLPEVRKMYTDNRKWFNEMAGMLSMVYGNVYLFNQNNMEDCLLYSGRTYLIRYRKRIDTEIKNHIRHCLLKMYMQNMWINFHDLMENVAKQVDQGESSFGSFVVQINQEVCKKSEQSVPLRQVLDVVFQQLQLVTDGDVVKLIKSCPSEMQEDILKNWSQILSDSNAGRILLLKYTEQVLKTPVGEKVILDDFSNAVLVLQECAEKCSPLSERINEMIRRLIGKSEEEDMTSITMDRATGGELVRLLKNIHKFLLERSRTGGFYAEESEVLSERVKELFGSMDILIDTEGVLKSNLADTPSEQLQNAVRLGIQVTLVKLLQKFYIYQTVHEKYDNRHSMSSRDLEQVELDGQIKETYYSQFYQHLCDLVAVAPPADGDGPFVESEDIKTDISTTCISAREHYIDTLIERAENE